MENEPANPPNGARRIALVPLGDRKYIRVDSGTTALVWVSQNNKFYVAVEPANVVNDVHFFIHLTEDAFELRVEDAYRQCITINGDPLSMVKADLHDADEITITVQGALVETWVIMMNTAGILDIYRPGPYLSRGAHGFVFRGQHRQDNSLVALKSIRRISFSHENDPDRAYNNLVQREHSVLNIIGTHPNILKYCSSWFGPFASYIVTEYLSAGDLLEALQKVMNDRVSYYSESATQIIMRQVCAGLEYLHSRGIVHRDIKLENIMFDPRYGVKIIDFGLAEILPADGSGIYGRIGTLPYMAPEVQAYQRQTEKADCWSTAIVMQTLLLGLPVRYTYVPDQLRTHNVSDEAIFLLAEMFSPEGRFRPTMSAVLQHAWFRAEFEF